MAKVCKTYVGDDNKVRKVDVEYKNLNPAEDTKIYKGKSFTRVERPVQKLVVLLPIDCEENSLPPSVLL